MSDFRIICGISLGHQYLLVSGDRTTTSVPELLVPYDGTTELDPEFELYVILEEHFCGSSEQSRFVMKA